MRSASLFRPFVVAALGVTLTLAACGKDAADTTALAEPTEAVETTAAAESAAPNTDAVETTATAGTEAPATEAAPFETVPGAPDSLSEAAIPSDDDLGGPLILAGNGIGPFVFGQKADGVIAGLTKIFGPPTEDTGWAPTQAPCDGMGSRSRYVSWGRLGVNFADGPTATINAPGEHFSSYGVYGDIADTPPLDRFVFNDGQQAIGRDQNEMRAWDPSVTFFTSDIEGPVWSVGSGLQEFGGSFDTPQGAKAPRVQSVRAGLICID